MSTAEREVMDAGVAHHPSTSLALVPLPADRHVMVDGWAVPRPRANQWHGYFYGLGYAGSGLVLLGSWLWAYDPEASIGLYGLAIFCMGLGGLGVLIHLAIPPRTAHKVRTTLGGIAWLVLMIAVTPVIQTIAREVRATSLAATAQPLVDRDGTEEEMRRIGVEAVDARPGHILLTPAGTPGWWMLYLRPGHVLPPGDPTIVDFASWHTEPLGGGWYIVTRD